MTSLGSAVQTAVRRGRTSGSYLGTVTAIDGVEFALTVDIGTGTPLTGVRWVGSYTPAVSDFVTVVRFGSAWVVLGKLSKDLRGGAVARETVTLAPVATWQAMAYWYTASETSAWSWSAGGVQQGRSGGAPPSAQVWGGAAIFAPLAGTIPSGATVETARVAMTREWDDGTLTPRSPRIYGYNTDGPTGTAGPSAGFTAGYGPWSPGTLVQGQTGTWALPSTWVTALLTGALRGVALYSQSPTDLLNVRPNISLTITYRL